MPNLSRHQPLQQVLQMPHPSGGVEQGQFAAPLDQLAAQRLAPMRETKVSPGQVQNSSLRYPGGISKDLPRGLTMSVGF